MPETYLLIHSNGGELTKLTIHWVFGLGVFLGLNASLHFTNVQKTFAIIELIEFIQKSYKY